MKYEQGLSLNAEEGFEERSSEALVNYSFYSFPYFIPNWKFWNISKTASGWQFVKIK